MKNENQIHSLKEQIMRNRQKKLYYTFFIVMVVIVFLYTVYYLILPANTLEETQEVLKCSFNAHQHIVECRDEEGTLICGEANFVIHTHNEYCYNTDGRLICKLPETEAHEHTDDCYETQQILICTNEEEGHTHEDNCYQTEKKLVCEESAILHIHDDTCYDENGTLTCGMLQLTEHTHNTECFSTAEETAATTTTNNGMTETTVTNYGTTETTATNYGTTETTATNYGTTETTITNNSMTETTATNYGTTEITTTNDGTTDITATTTNDIMTTAADSVNDIMMMSDTASDADWGYNNDGSIFWHNIADKTNVYFDNIQVDTPYVLAGCFGNHVLTNELCTDSENADKLAVKSAPGSDADYFKYAIWRFEKAGDKTDEYYIHDNNGKYVKMQGTNTSLVDKNDASVFLVKQAERTECITIYSESEGNYINISGSDDNRYCNGYWEAYEEADGGSQMRVINVTKGGQQTAQKINTVSSPNTVINLFDYWITDNQDDPDNFDVNSTTGLFAGINENHPFKFTRGNVEEKINRWTGQGAKPLQGIVKNTLGSDRYPALSGRFQVPEDSTDSGDGSTESLKYLFDPTENHAGKQSYRNVSGLLTIDDEGYYSYDSAKNAAEFNEESNSFNVYNKPNVNSQFFPFNYAPEVMTLARDDEKMNHYFGVTITTRFVQQNNGYTDIRHSKQTTFEFSGDDDVWIFIDDVLIGDVGGIHDKANVKINFATGDVEVSVIDGNTPPLTTTLKECYENAGKNTDGHDWTTTSDNQRIYADNTIHTLKFFYLERGNYDSHMKLRYNLTAIPKTAIYKVNQYGDAVPGAKFAVYAANEKYEMLYNLNGEIVRNDTGKYDSNGNLVDGGNIIAESLYTGTTDQNGEMIFVDQDGMPYSINELQDKFGTHFILREIEVPNGYRVVKKDVQLYIWEGENQKILRCANTEQSGSRAAPSMQITATDKLFLKTPYKGADYVQYCNNKGETFGTLFAVVYRYVGNIDENGNATQIVDGENWIPVYGSDKKGYQIIDMKDKSLLEGALEAARKAQDYGKVTFEHSYIGTMQLTLNNLPGHITTYYHMLGQGQKQQARYTVAYYWTESASLDTATPENTYWVDSFGGTTTQGEQYSSFELVYGADIHVPNLFNKVFVQKVDEENNLIDGATFAIYEVEQSTDGAIQYILTDGSRHILSKDAVVSSEGVITDGDVTINPRETKVTETYDDGIHTGTAEFTNLPEGQYIIKEVNPPSGYKLNKMDVMVLVTENTIYANAGTEDDGITVGRGPGYLVTPLSQFASEGQIDNTLTWIYAQMRISNESTSFADVGDNSKIKGYISKNYTSETTSEESGAFRTYLKYTEENIEKAFNYVPNDDRNGIDDSDGYRRLFTTSGWSYYEIYQDYEYGKNHANDANYDDWHNHELTNLFSRSTYIRVTDEHKPTLKVKKVDAINMSTVLGGASFRLYKYKLENGKKTQLYYCWNSENQSIGWSENADEAFIVTTGNDGMSDDNFIGMSDGEYYLEEVDSPDGYCKLNESMKLILGKSLTLDSETDKQIAVVAEDEKNKNIYTITVYNYASFELPATGGSGTLPYTLVGIMLMAVPLVYVCIKNHRLKTEKEYNKN